MWSSRASGYCTCGSRCAADDDGSPRGGGVTERGLSPRRTTAIRACLQLANGGARSPVGRRGPDPVESNRSDWNCGTGAILDSVTYRDLPPWHRAGGSRGLITALPAPRRRYGSWRQRQLPPGPARRRDTSCGNHLVCTRSDPGCVGRCQAQVPGTTGVVGRARSQSFPRTVACQQTTK
jgi:hypothetical protein